MLCARVPRSLAWPLLRLACGGLSLALIAGACSLDERTLSDAKLLDSTEHEDPIECGSTGETACATCLYAECCEQAQACDLGSSCSSYLECAGSCNSDQTCIDTCGTNYPSGFGDAVALSVCARSRCRSCSGQTSTTLTCDPTGPGACQSSADCAAFEGGALQNLDLSECAACQEDLLSAECQRCLSQHTALSTGCSQCVASWLSCAVNNCLLACEGGSDPQSCEQCMSRAGCTLELASCGFSG